MIGEISQSNTASDTSTANQSNVSASWYQISSQNNDCDGSEGDGDNNEKCTNSMISDMTNNNILVTVGQFNIAFNDSTSQSNQASLSQVANQRNDCDDSGEGDNAGFCNNNFNVSLIASTNQGNQESFSTANQSNELSLSQVANQNNDCDGSGNGDNNGAATNEALTPRYGVFLLKAELLILQQPTNLTRLLHPK